MQWRCRNFCVHPTLCRESHGKMNRAKMRHMTESLSIIHSRMVAKSLCHFHGIPFSYKIIGLIFIPIRLLDWSSDHCSLISIKICHPASTSIGPSLIRDWNWNFYRSFCIETSGVGIAWGILAGFTSKLWKGSCLLKACLQSRFCSIWCQRFISYVSKAFSKIVHRTSISTRYSSGI